MIRNASARKLTTPPFYLLCLDGRYLSFSVARSLRCHYLYPVPASGAQCGRWWLDQSRRSAHSIACGSTGTGQARNTAPRLTYRLARSYAKFHRGLTNDNEDYNRSKRESAIAAF